MPRSRGLLFFAALLALLPAGCATTVRAPRQVLDPVPVYLIDGGRHSSIILPDPDGGLWEYAYGEWEWFALGREQWWRVPEVLLWPTPGALGTRRLAGPATWDTVAYQAPHEHMYELMVERRRVDALRSRLAGQMAGGEAAAVDNPRQNLRLVPDPRDYHLFYQCNEATADWLAELGCRVEGGALWADFLVTP